MLSSFGFERRWPRKKKKKKKKSKLFAKTTASSAPMPRHMLEIILEVLQTYRKSTQYIYRERERGRGSLVTAIKPAMDSCCMSNRVHFTVHASQRRHCQHSICSPFASDTVYEECDQSSIRRGCLGIRVQDLSGFRNYWLAWKTVLYSQLPLFFFSLYMMMMMVMVMVCAWQVRVALSEGNATPKPTGIAKTTFDFADYAVKAQKTPIVLDLSLPLDSSVNLKCKAGIIT